VEIVVLNFTASPGTIGSYSDVDLVNNSASAVTIASFGVDVLHAPGPLGFESLVESVNAPYIFSITGDQPGVFTSVTRGPETWMTDLAATGGQVVNPGETWGLAAIGYGVSSTATPGTTVPITLETTSITLGPPAGTFLLDPTGAPVQFVMVNGTFTVGAIPEPSSLALLGISSLALVLGKRFVRRDG
jgi:hypothetical protein